MILLDTNIISELMKPAPDKAVEGWLQKSASSPFATTAITASELVYGIERLPTGKRRESLLERLNVLVGGEGGLSAFPFDDMAAQYCGQFRAMREAAGMHAHPSDMMIAGIAAALDTPLATRNIKDFSGLPIELVNPWKE